MPCGQTVAGLTFWSLLTLELTDWRLLCDWQVAVEPLLSRVEAAPGHTTPPPHYRDPTQLLGQGSGCEDIGQKLQTTASAVPAV